MGKAAIVSKPLMHVAKKLAKHVPLDEVAQKAAPDFFHLVTGPKVLDTIGTRSNAHPGSFLHNNDLQGALKNGRIKTYVDNLPDATNCGYVLKVGPLAYYDKEKFPTGPWCKKGDWVIFARYAGSRLPIEGGEVRLLNDDEVLGKIDNPESVLHNI